MTHPHHHHATRAAWALTTARRRLDDAVECERAQQRADALTTAAARNIQAWRPVVGRGGGGHGDPVTNTIVGFADAAVRDLRPGRLARLQVHVDQRLHWVTRGVPLSRVVDLIPQMSPVGAKRLTTWFDGLDKETRTALDLDPDGTPLPGRRCPRCASRRLTAHTTGPRRSWTVTCTCVCGGPSCPCGMTTTVVDLPHIWGDGHPLITALTSAAA